MEEVELAYLAGLFDGEGSACIFHHHRSHDSKRPRTHELLVNIGSTNEAVLLWVKEVIGFGTMHRKMSAGMPGARKPIWYWETSCKKAETFLRMVQPYCKIKAPQIEEGLAFRQRQRDMAVSGKFTYIYGDCLKMKALNGRNEPCTNMEGV